MNLTVGFNPQQYTGQRNYRAGSAQKQNMAFGKLNIEYSKDLLANAIHVNNKDLLSKEQALQIAERIHPDIQSVIEFFRYSEETLYLFIRQQAKNEPYKIAASVKNKMRENTGLAVSSDVTTAEITFIPKLKTFISKN